MAMRLVSQLWEKWTLNTAILKAIASDCKQQQVPLLFTRLPMKGSSPSEDLVRFFRSEGLPFIDVPAQPHPDHIHFATDGHINSKGHEVVAGAISEWVSKSNVLPHLIR
jgi:hypothetical protein